MKINLKEKTLAELKALAYDLLVDQQLINNSLQAVQLEINEKVRQTAQPVAAESVTDN